MRVAAATRAMKRLSCFCYGFASAGDLTRETAPDGSVSSTKPPSTLVFVRFGRIHLFRAESNVMHYRGGN